jgi:hypothetical protein
MEDIRLINMTHDIIHHSWQSSVRIPRTRAGRLSVVVEEAVMSVSRPEVVMELSLLG